MSRRPGSRRSAQTGYVDLSTPGPAMSSTDGPSRRSAVAAVRDAAAQSATRAVHRHNRHSTASSGRRLLDEDGASNSAQSAVGSPISISSRSPHGFSPTSPVSRSSKRKRANSFQDNESDASGSTAVMMRRSEKDETILQELRCDFYGMRRSLKCRICFQLLHEPFTVACGHTFCYSCLCQWFKQAQSCPECRTVVTQQPAPAYLLKEISEVFHRNAKRHQSQLASNSARRQVANEAAARKNTVDQDKANLDPETGGLFQGRFDPTRSLQPRFDPSDGVMRCPYCNWEVEEGACEQCGIRFHDSEFSDLDFDPDTLRDFADPEHRSWGAHDLLSDIVTGSEDDSFSSDGAMGPVVVARGQRIPGWGTGNIGVRLPVSSTSSSVGVRHRRRRRRGSSVTPSEAMETVDEVEEEEATSLDGFIVESEGSEVTSSSSMPSTISDPDPNSSELESSERDTSAEPPDGPPPVQEETSDEDEGGRITRGPGGRRMRQPPPPIASRGSRPGQNSQQQRDTGSTHTTRNSSNGNRNSTSRESENRAQQSSSTRSPPRIIVPSQTITHITSPPVVRRHVNNNRSVASSARTSDGRYHAGVDGVDESSSSHGYARYHLDSSDFGNPVDALRELSDDERSRVAASLALDRQTATTPSVTAARRSRLTNRTRSGTRNPKLTSSASRQQQDGEWEDENADSDGTEKGGQAEIGSFVSEEPTASTANERMQNVLSYLDAQPEDIRAKPTKASNGERRKTGYDRKISMVFAETLDSSTEQPASSPSGISKLGGVAQQHVSRTIEPATVLESPPRPSGPLPDSAKNRNRVTLNGIAADALSSEQRRQPAGLSTTNEQTSGGSLSTNMVDSNARTSHTNSRHRSRGSATVSSINSSNAQSRNDGVSTSFSSSTKPSSFGTSEKAASSKHGELPVIHHSVHHDVVDVPLSRESRVRSSAIQVDHETSRQAPAMQGSQRQSGLGLGLAANSLGSNNPYNRLLQPRRQTSRPRLRTRRSNSSLRPRASHGHTSGSDRTEKPQETSPRPTSRSKSGATHPGNLSSAIAPKSKQEKVGGTRTKSPSRGSHSSSAGGAISRKQSASARQAA